ncbi:MAG: endonuclease domain-containing protein [Deltaproteobacteria bacterium]|nr:endonuclease domain-containing protein [Deltaproteobacteria bacterium]
MVNRVERREEVVKARILRHDMTRAECLLWDELRNRGLKGLKFKRQLPLRGYIADFCCVEKRLIVELDGGHHLKEDQKIYDEERDKILGNGGFRILRILNSEVETNLPRVLEKIKTTCSKM